MDDDFKFIDRQKWLFYEKQWEAADYYPALVALGRAIYADEEINDAATLAKPLPALDETIKAAVTAGARQVADRIMHILSIGEEYDPDEVLLVLTRREELQVINQLFRRFYNAPLNLSLDDIDDKIIQRLGKSSISPAGRRLLHRLRYEWARAER